MKIAIIGAGAIGRLFAWFLAQGGAEPIFRVRRAEQAEALRQSGLTVVEADGREHRLSVEAICNDDPLPTDIDGILLTVKSYDTQSAAELLPQGADIPVLSLQNGLGNGGILAQRIEPARLALGLTSYGATAEGETKVYARGIGQTVLGDWADARATDSSKTSPAAWWLKRLAPSGHQLKLTSDIRTEVWRKAMVNIGINPITALFELRNGELLQEEGLLRFMAKTVAEAERVARAEGVPLQDSFANVLDVCRLTAANLSSMLQDKLKNRPTEIHSLCGVIAELGRKHGLSTPCNSLLLQLLQSQTKCTEKEMRNKMDMLC